MYSTEMVFVSPFKEILAHTLIKDLKTHAEVATEMAQWLKVLVHTTHEGAQTKL